MKITLTVLGDSADSRSPPALDPGGALAVDRVSDKNNLPWNGQDGGSFASASFSAAISVSSWDCKCLWISNASLRIASASLYVSSDLLSEEAAAMF